MAIIKTKKTSDTESATTESGGGSKTAFVMSLPTDMPASQVVAKAAEAGLKLREKYVYNIRAAARLKAQSGNLPRKKPGPKPGAKAARRAAGAVAPRETAATFSSAITSTTATNAVEARFLDAALDLGLARASELLERLRSKLKKFVL